MLGFFRKYQKYFYVVITVVIVISFSFFGTYSTLQRNDYVDKTAFTAIDGSEVGRLELEEFVRFIATDNEDKLLLGGAWGINFLNDGVIKKDFIETGMAQILVKPYLQEMAPELKMRHQKERNFRPYTHPQAPVLSAVNAWNVVAPEVNTHLKALVNLNDPASEEAFAQRAQLFIAERRFPHSALRMVLRYQQRQYQWINPDPNLDRTDLALFGYHTVGDWFGPRFERLVAEFIINSAAIAEKKGYYVTKEEVLADLFRNAEISFQQNSNNPNLGVATTQQYFDEQLRRMGLDKSGAIAIWKKVMLFRRMFHDMGNSVLIDPLTVEEVQRVAKETLVGELYQLPKEFQFADFETLQKFELYLDGVSQRPKSGVEMLALPEKFRSGQEVSKTHPELVQYRYLLDIAQTDKRALATKVAVKQTWEWEVRDENWEKLKKQFPELGTKDAGTAEGRYQALNALDSKTRTRVDSFAREQIVNEHPEWLTQALEEAEGEQKVVGIRKKGKNAVFSGLKNPEELLNLLNAYPQSADKLAQYSPDGRLYYRIKVVDRSQGDEVLTFNEALQTGALDELLQPALQKHYEALRAKNGAAFKNSDGGWKELAQVKNEVAKSLFGNVLDAIKSYHHAVVDPEGSPKAMIPDYAASLRFYAYMRGMKERFRQDPDEIATGLYYAAPSLDNGKLASRPNLGEQWKLTQVEFKGNRTMANLPFKEEEAFALEDGAWTSVLTRANGDLTFFQLQKKTAGMEKADLYEKVMQMQQTLSEDAQKVLMRKLLVEMQGKNALSLDFLKAPTEES